MAEALCEGAMKHGAVHEAVTAVTLRNLLSGELEQAARQPLRPGGVTHV